MIKLFYLHIDGVDTRHNPPFIIRVNSNAQTAKVLLFPRMANFFVQKNEAVGL